MVGATFPMLTLSFGPLLAWHTGHPCWSPCQGIHKGSSWSALPGCCIYYTPPPLLFYSVVSMFTHHPPEPTEPRKRQDYIPQQQELSCTVMGTIPDEVLTHSQVLVVRLLPWYTFFVLGSAGVESQGWAKGGHLVQPRVIVMLLPTTQLLSFMPTPAGIWH